MSELTPCFRGVANVWECDEMGHLNVRYYVSKAEEGVGVLAAQLGLTPPYLRDHQLELVIQDQHIRYIREFRGGADVWIDGGVLDFGKDHIRFYQVFRAPGSDQIAGTLISLVQLHHAENESYRPFPGFALKAAEGLLCTIPDAVKPRSLTIDGPISGGTKAQAESLGLKLISSGQVLPTEVDQWQRFQTFCYMGRISDGIGTLMKGLRSGIAAQMSQGTEIGGAALEYRLIYHKRPRLGDVLGVYACLSKVTNKIFVLTHWTVDMATGEPLCSSTDVAVSLDLKARKAVPIPPEFQEAYQAQVIENLDQFTVT